MMMEISCHITHPGAPGTLQQAKHPALQDSSLSASLQPKNLLDLHTSLSSFWQGEKRWSAG